MKSEHSCFERVQIPFKFHFSFHFRFHFSFQVSFHFSFHFSLHLNKTARQVCLKTQFALPWRAELGMVTCEVFPSKVHWCVLRKSFFNTKFDPQNVPRSPRGHPKPGSDTERGSQSASSAPGDAPGAPLEVLRGRTWEPSDLQIYSFLFRKCKVSQFLRFTASSAPGANNRHHQSGAGNTFWSPAPRPPEL